MRTAKSTATVVLFLMLLLGISGCLREQTSHSAEQQDKTATSESGETRIYTPITPDSLIREEVITTNVTADGFDQTRRFVYGVSEGDALAKPCPCCPIGLVKCCKICDPWTSLIYRGQINPVVLSPSLVEVLSATREFARSGKVIITYVVKTSFVGDSMDVTFVTSASGPGAGSMAGTADTTVAHVSMMAGGNWAMVPVEYPVSPGEATFTLSALAGAEGEKSINARSMQMSYYRDRR